MREIFGLLLAACMLMAWGCARERPLSPVERETFEAEQRNSLYPGGMDSRLPAARRFPGLEPGELAPASQRSALEATSMGMIMKIAHEIEQLKPRYPELSDFSDGCVEDDGLALRYSRNVVQGELDTTLGDGQACEIVVECSPIVDRGPSFIPWENYTVLYPRLGWQVCSYPASYWLRTSNGSLQFGGRFVRSYSLELCNDVNQIVCRNLRYIESIHGRQEEARSANPRAGMLIERRVLNQNR